MLTNACIWVRRAARGWGRKVDMRKLGLTEQIIKKGMCRRTAHQTGVLVRETAAAAAGSVWGS